MPSKTPKFDESLNQIFSTLVPHERVCNACEKNFQIEAEDIEFLKKLRVPPPTLCPRCRLQRRMAHRCQLKPAFQKKRCSGPDHTEDVLTFLDANSNTVVYDDEYYRSDEWDGLNFGVSYDAEKSFFDQFTSFAPRIPRQTLFKDPSNVKSDYAIGGMSASNCYYVAVPLFSENLQYGSSGFYSKDSIDFLNLSNSENCYSCVNVYRSFDCKFSINSSDCFSSSFLYDCKNCSDCFGTTNLRNKRYVFFNQQLTKEEYFCKLLEVDLGSQNVLEEYKTRFAELTRGAIRKNLDNQKVAGSVGNDLRQANNCYNCFQINRGENLRHTALVLEQMTDCMDFFGGALSSLAYETTAISDATLVLFSIWIRTGQNVEYSMECNNVQNVFGCVGLKNKKFCIFNMQYNEEECWPKLDDIKCAMLEMGEYGEFFPMTMSAIAYNDSSAQVEFPLKEQEVRSRSLLWHNKSGAGPAIDQSKLIQTADLPGNIKGTDDSILNRVIICAESGRPFRFTPYELEFYRKHRIALPRLHPDVRIDKLFEYSLPFHLYDDICKKCEKEMKSGYDPTLGYKVYCEQCYQQEVI